MRSLTAFRCAAVIVGRLLVRSRTPAGTSPAALRPGRRPGLPLPRSGNAVWIASISALNSASRASAPSRAYRCTSKSATSPPKELSCYCACSASVDTRRAHSSRRVHAVNQLVSLANPRRCDAFRDLSSRYPAVWWVPPFGRVVVSNASVWSGRDRSVLDASIARRNSAT